MGFRVSWLAVKGIDRSALLERLGLAATGEREELPESPFVCTTLPSGHHVVFANDAGYVYGLPLDRLSRGAELIACTVNETTMYSRAECFRDSVAVWSVEHDCERGRYDVTTAGELPPEYGRVNAELKREQDEAGGESADVDYIFDVPVELARALTGFRHDHDPSDEKDPWEIIEPN